MTSYVYLNLHVPDMEDRTQYSFAEYTTEAILAQMKEADAEMKRINNLRRSEMSSYEEDDLYDEVENWKQQASVELARRAAAEEESSAEEDDRWHEEEYAQHSTNPRENSEPSHAFMTPLTPDQVQRACDILEEKRKKMGTLPTVDEYWEMEPADRMRWSCLICCHPAVEGSVIPGSYCSVRCAAQKYS